MRGTARERASISRIVLEDLARWRRLAEIIAEAVRELRPDAEVYVVGGAAEGRLTILSDIDVVVVLPCEPSYEEAIDLIGKIFEEAEKRGLPVHAPVELHIVGPRGMERLLRRSKAVKINVKHHNTIVKHAKQE